MILASYQLLLFDPLPTDLYILFNNASPTLPFSTGRITPWPVCSLTKHERDSADLPCTRAQDAVHIVGTQ